MVDYSANDTAEERRQRHQHERLVAIIKVIWCDPGQVCFRGRCALERSPWKSNMSEKSAENSLEHSFCTLKLYILGSICVFSCLIVFYVISCRTSFTMMQIWGVVRSHWFLAKAKVDGVNILCDLAENRPVLAIVFSRLNNCGWLVLQDLLRPKAAPCLW